MWTSYIPFLEGGNCHPHTVLQGMDYMIAAFHHADRPIDVVVGKLDGLTAILEQNIEREGVEMLRRDAEVRAKRLKLSRSFGVLGLGDEVTA